MKTTFSLLLRSLRNGFVAIGALAFLGTVVAVAANYTVTQGTGTTFASAVISTVNYAEMLICDATAGATQCAAVNSSGQLAVAGPVTNAGTFAVQLSGASNNINNIAGTVSLPTGAATSTNQSTEISSLATIATNTGAAIPAGTNIIGYTTADPCSQAAKTNVPISTASGTAALVTGISAKKIYVCSLVLIVPSAVSVSLSEGSGTTCGTSNQAGVIGVATNGTAANGLALPANGGLTLGNGNGTVAATATAADYLCLFQSGTAQIAGNLTFVQQ